jgi:DNA primase
MSNVYSEELIEEIRSRNDIVDVISGYVLLKKSGTSYKAKCPFHTENTPSFSVSPDKQIYHCFGCGVGGNVISFIMSIENLGFVDALKLLADRGGISLPDQYEAVDKEKYKSKQTQYNIHKESARYYYDNLKKSKTVLNYLNMRKITSETIIRFGLGYASEDWEGLYQHLLKKNYSIDEIAQSGLVIPKKNQKGHFYDRFRNRLIFPVFNLTNKVIAFGGRVLDQQLPKYLNSPETILFSKGHHLYGLNNAKNNIKDGQIIIVEGYMDVISLYQHGMKNVVASLGTALTREQAKLLNRYADEIIIAYDGDDAGRKATLRALDIFAGSGCKVRVMKLPKGLDPDEYIKKYKLEGFIYQIKKGLPLVEYKIMLAREKYNINSTEGKIDFSKEVAQILKNIKSEIEIDGYIKKISKETGINEAAIKSEVYSNKRMYNRDKTPKNRIGNNRNTIEYKANITSNDRKNAIILAEENLLNAISQDLEVFIKVKKFINWDDFTLDIHRDIAKIIYKKMNNKETVIPGQLLDIFNSEHEGQVISGIFSKNYDKEFIDKNIMEYINTIRIYKLQEKINNLNNSIKLMSKENNVNVEKTNRIYIEIIELKKKLEALKGK